MTRDQIEVFAKNMVPDLVIALEAVLSGQSLHIFECASGTNSTTGIKSRIFCFIAQEHSAILLEATAQGAQKSMEFLIEQAQQAQSKLIIPQ